MTHRGVTSFVVSEYDVRHGTARRSLARPGTAWLRDEPLYYVRDWSSWQGEAWQSHAKLGEAQQREEPLPRLSVGDLCGPPLSNLE